MSIRNKDEPNTAPVPDRWYTLTLGNSFKDDQQPSSKFCTLRYEFKPASIDKTQPGTLHKTKDNKISVEFNNNQLGKPKVTFEGSSEDYKENDAVLFFDGQTLRLERLHRAVKRLRHVRLPGESSAATLAGTASVDPSSPPLGKGAKVQVQNLNTRPTFTPPPPPSQPLPMSVEVERIDIGDAGGSGGNTKSEKSPITTKSPITPPTQPAAASSPDSAEIDLEAELNIMNDDDDEDAVEPGKTNSEEKPTNVGFDINLPHQNDTDDDEIADVDVNDDNGGMVRNAAEALRAQVNAAERVEGSSSDSGSSSESESSDSSSGSSSSGSSSESSDGDSVNSI